MRLSLTRVMPLTATVVAGPLSETTSVAAAVVAGGGSPFFDATAVPSTYGGIGATGTRSFYTNESGVMYFVSSGTAPTASGTTRVVSGGAPLN